MNASEIQAALGRVTTEPVQWAETEPGGGSVYVGSEDNVDAIIVIGPFPYPDAEAEVDAVDVGMNGSEHPVRATDVEAVVQAVQQLLA